MEAERRRERPQGVCLRRFRARDDGAVSRPLPDLPELPERRPAGGGVERRGPRQLEPLTPAERQLRRRNRRLLALVAVPGLLLGAVALAASLAASGNPPAPHPLTVPAGYKAVGDGVFAYSVPLAWSKNLGYSDDTGDLDFSGTTGWAGEHLGASRTAPGAGGRPPASFSDFGENRPTPYTLGPAERITVAGATVAYRYEMTRPGGFEAVAIHAWQSSSGAEIWLLVHAPPEVTSTVVGSLNGG